MSIEDTFFRAVSTSSFSNEIPCGLNHSGPMHTATVPVSSTHMSVLTVSFMSQGLIQTCHLGVTVLKSLTFCMLLSCGSLYQLFSFPQPMVYLVSGSWQPGQCQAWVPSPSRTIFVPTIKSAYLADRSPLQILGFVAEVVFSLFPLVLESTVSTVSTSLQGERLQVSTTSASLSSVREVVSYAARGLYHPFVKSNQQPWQRSMALGVFHRTLWSTQLDRPRS